MATDSKEPKDNITVIPAAASTESHPNSQRNTDLSNAYSRLQLFQILVGIQSPASLRHDDPESNPRSGMGAQHTNAEPANVGLYRRAITEERRSRIAYNLTSYISNMLYMLQILLAATFTALSAYQDSSRVILTVLGALNTVLAGYVNDGLLQVFSNGSSLTMVSAPWHGKRVKVFHNVTVKRKTSIKP